MRQIHQKFTYYINRAHKRRGTLWADRFKSTILDGATALWNCVKYVELNSVRAGLVIKPEDYRFCTWGWYSGTGKHYFGDNFVRHMRSFLGESANGWSDEDINWITGQCVEKIWPEFASKTPLCAELVEIMERQMKEHGRL